MLGHSVGQYDQQVGEWFGHKFSIFCMKETEYISKLMSTNGSLIPETSRKEERRQSKSGEIISLS